MDDQSSGFTPPQNSTPGQPDGPLPTGDPPHINEPISGKSPFGSRNMIIGIVIVALLVGGGLYYNKKQNEKDLEELMSLLDDLGDDYDYDYDTDTDYDDYSYGERESYLTYESETPGYYTFSDTKYFFDIDYPMDWELDPDDSIVAASFMTPYEDSLDFFGENVNVTTEDLSWYGPMTLQEYGDSSIEQIQLALPGYEVVEVTDDYLGTNEAQFILGSYPMGDFNTRILSAFTIVDETAYVVTYTYEAEKEALYADEVAHMMDSFEVW